MLVQIPPAELAPRFWMLGTTPYPLYLYRGGDYGTLFEGGAGAMGPVLDEQLQRLGIPGDYVRQAVVTHAHPDHVMAIPMFRQLFPRVAILASAPAAKTMSVEKAISFFGKLDDLLTTSLVGAGVVTEQQRQPTPSAAPFAVDRVVKEGDTIAVDEDLAFHVLETPGHSDCSLSFHEPRHGILLISDATGYYLPEQDEWWPNYFLNYGDYLRSMDRLAALQAEVLCLSHNAVVCGAADVSRYFRRAIAASEQYHARIVREFKSGRTPREISESLGTEAYARTPLLPVEFFQKNCGLLVKLSLAHEGLEGQ